MSLETWKQAFYPVPADECDKSDAVAHSLRKWEGLRPENLAAHGVNPVPGGIKDNTGSLGSYLDITAGTCALCAHYYDDDKPEDEEIEPEDHACGTCPLYLARGNKSCCEQRAGEAYTPYANWTAWQQPEPMIHWLRIASAAQAAPGVKAQAWEDANDPKPTVEVRVHEGPKPEDARITADEAIALGEAIHQHVLDTSHKPAPKPPIGGLHHEGPALPPPREGD